MYVLKLQRQEFFEELTQWTRYLPGYEYAQCAPEGAYWARFSGRVDLETSRLIDAQIFVNLDDFKIRKQDFTHLIPISIRHEAAELFFQVKDGFRLPLTRTTNLNAHQLALREQYRYARSLGQDEEYFRYINTFTNKLSPIEGKEIRDEHRQAFFRNQ